MFLVQMQNADDREEETVEDARAGCEVVQFLRQGKVPGMEEHTKGPG